MEEINSTKKDSISWSEAARHGSGVPLFEHNAPKGSIITWRNRRKTGGSPNARLAMSEIVPFEKEDAPQTETIELPIEWCKCSLPQVDVRSGSCEFCGFKYDFYGEGKG